MKALKVFIPVTFLSIILLACNKNETEVGTDLSGTTWECDTTWEGSHYFYRISFTSNNEFDYYEDGFIVLNEIGTYSYTPPKIIITIWSVPIEGSIEGNKLYYPTLAGDGEDPFVRIFTKQ